MTDDKQDPSVVATLEWDSIDTTCEWSAISDFFMCYRISLRTDGMKALRLEWLGNRTDDLGLFASWDDARAAANRDFSFRCEPLSRFVTSDLTAMKAELEEAKKERGEKQPAAAGLVELDGVTMTPAAAANRLRAAEQERDELREALNLAAINRATEPSNGGTA